MKPLLITQGDVCGIGPEIIARAYLQGQADDAVVIGDAAVMRRALRQVRGAQGDSLPWAVAAIDALEDLRDCPPRCIPVLRPGGLPDDLVDLPMGRVDARAGLAAAACITEATRLVQAGAGRAMVTAPIHKEALAAAGVPFPGHTEMLQALSVPPGEPLPPVRMMLANDELRTVLVTIHLSLRRAIEAISFESVLQTIEIAHHALRAAGVSAPRIAVAGLNPHAGEGGLFGDEELRIIAPAVEAARTRGLNVHGPLAPDTVFMRARHTAARAGEFDVVVSMVHDHGLIAVKYLGVEQGVNVTLGLPLVRTSPDHGTAFDIAGQGLADASSLVAALRMARTLAPVEGV